ncbi:hypothetical protein [Haloglomus litoreum]|uniref:hypothetical protein n=1 Tax=Haloglomus litoreum TaxID=3034026 RepID=UPI0023E87B70|nr:hypothetical protein [Haloglomus sp. DT116]
MTIADAYRRLGTVLSELESQGIEVAAVTPDETADAEPLVVDLRIAVPADADAPEVRFGESHPPEDLGADSEPQAASTAESSPSSPGTAPGSGTAQPDEAGGSAAGDATGGTADAEFPCAESGCSAGFDSAAALTVHRLAAHERPEEPLYQHEPALRAAYEAYDSFASMTEALGVDVTAQTVRRNMMKVGIHDPDSGDGGTADEDESEAASDAAEPTGAAGGGAGDGVPDSGEAAADEQTIADGSGAAASRGAEAPGGPAGGSADPETDTAPSDPAAEPLPADVTVEDLRAAVVEGGSLRAVARSLDRSSDETRSLLAELGLLEQVHGRVATRPDRAQRAAAFDDWLEAARRGDGGST